MWKVFHYTPRPPREQPLDDGDIVERDRDAFLLSGADVLPVSPSVIIRLGWHNRRVLLHDLLAPPSTDSMLDGIANDNGRVD